MQSFQYSFNMVSFAAFGEGFYDEGCRSTQGHEATDATEHFNGVIRYKTIQCHLTLSSASWSTPSASSHLFWAI